MQKNIAIVAVIVIIAGGSFYGGMKYAQGSNSMTTKDAQTGAAGFAGRGARGGRGNGGGVGGDIIAKDDTSITIQLQDGGSQIVFLSSAIPVTKSVSGAVSDLAVGTRVMAFGTKNSDGSFNAQSVQIRPAGRPDATRGSQGQ